MIETPAMITSAPTAATGRPVPDPVRALAPSSERPVVAAVDLTRGPDRARGLTIARVAGTLASAAGVPLHVVHAWSAIGASVHAYEMAAPAGERAWRLRRRERRDRWQDLRALVEALRHPGPVEAWLVQGRPGPVVRRVARRVRAQVVVLGALHPPALPGLVVGRMAEVLGGAPDCAVVLVPDRLDDPPGTAV